MKDVRETAAILFKPYCITGMNYSHIDMFVTKLTSERHHEALKSFLVFPKFHHKETTQRRVERCSTSHVVHLCTHIIYTQECKMFTLKEYKIHNRKKNPQVAMNYFI